MRTIPALFFAALLTFGSAVAHPVDAHAATVSTDPCPAVLLDDTITDATVAELLAADWYGDPTDGVEALYAPSCRDYAAAVDAPDSWPLGAGMYAVTLVAYAVQSAGWTAGLTAQGWTPAPAGAGVDADGLDHAPCLALIGDTTSVVCEDGWTTTS